MKVIYGIRKASRPSEMACLNLVPRTSLVLYLGKCMVFEQVLAVGRSSNSVETEK